MLAIDIIAKTEKEVCKIMACMNKSIEQINSEEIGNSLPKEIINLLWFIWETEFQFKEVKFNLKKSEDNKQIIFVFDDDIKLKSFIIKLTSPVNADVLITVPKNRFIMDMS